MSGILVGTMLILAGVLYGLMGNEQETAIYGPSAVRWMLNRWSGAGGDLSHCWIIPIVSLFIVWRRRDELSAAPKQHSYLGYTAVVAALLLHLLGMRAQLTRISLFSLIVLLWAIPWTLYGRRVAALLIFPCAYLIFCIPLSFLNSVTVPLRIIASTMSTAVLNALGIAAVQTGTSIRSAAAGGFNFDVADACSGLRSLLAMTALSAAYAQLTQRTLFKQWFVFLGAIPVAMAGNVARIVTIALIAEGISVKVALGVYHNYSAFIVFPVAILLMMGIGKLVNVDYRNKLTEWKQSVTSRTS